jgi:carboxyl-terminal processing protease
MMFNDSHNSPIDTLYFGIVTGLAILIAFGVGYAFGAGLTLNDAGALLDPAQRAARLQSDAQAPDEFEVFWEVWNLLDTRYFYGAPDDETRTYGAIQGMLDTLEDPYTSFAPPEAADLIRELDSGSFEGIGAYVEPAEEGGIAISRPFEGGPAEEAGLLAGDVILAVDGISIVELDMDAALMLVRGPAESEVTLTIKREGEAEPFDVVVTRRRIEVPTVESRMLDDEVGYIALFEFNQQASHRLDEAVEELLDQGAQSLILDLRDNPGGFLDQAVDVADLFMPKGEVLIQRDAEGQTRLHRSEDGDPGEDIPLAVLVNGDSASASEIVAGAIQDSDRGVLIGEQTFGKGSVQLQYDLADGSILRVTYAAWFTPNDRAINGEGIEPDVVVPNSAEAGDDIQLDTALDYLRDQS